MSSFGATLWIMRKLQDKRRASGLNLCNFKVGLLCLVVALVKYDSCYTG